MKDLFRRFARHTSQIVGSPITFILAVLVIVAWALTGSVFNYSNTWQLIINTGTTIVTFLMVFLIQNTQNRDSKALHLKLDELLRAVGDARNSMVEVEDMTDEELARLHEEFHHLQYETIVPELHRRGKKPLQPGDRVERLSSR
jgi:low affinity Fe/Cu permease